MTGNKPRITNTFIFTLRRIIRLVCSIIYTVSGFIGGMLYYLKYPGIFFMCYFIIYKYYMENIGKHKYDHNLLSPFTDMMLRSSYSAKSKAFIIALCIAAVLMYLYLFRYVLNIFYLITYKAISYRGRVYNKNLKALYAKYAIREHKAYEKFLKDNGIKEKEYPFYKYRVNAYKLTDNFRTGLYSYKNDKLFR